MAAGGFVYESETATYNSTTFSTKLDWALHLFRKQIYAFLHASTRSAQVNGEEHQYWDLDIDRLDSESIPLDDNPNGVHSISEWREVSEVLVSEGYSSSFPLTIENIQTSSSYSSSKPALVCYFVGRGGEHLAFTNYAQTSYSTPNNGSVVFANNIVCTSGENKYLPSGFGVVLSPYNDFTGAIANALANDVYPTDCLSPIGPKTALCTTSNSVYGTIIDDCSNGDSFTFGFAVKGSKVIVIVTSPKFDSTNSKGKRYMFLVFGDIYTQCQEGDTKTYGAVCGYETATTGEEQTTNTTSSGFTATNAVALSSIGERMCKFFTSSYDSVYYTYRELQRGFPIGHSSDLADGIPYTTLVVSFYQNTGGETQTDPLIKDGNGYKGIVDPEVMRFVPATVPVGTLGGGKFLVPRQISTSASTNYCFGWDPSNPSAI